MIDTTLMDCYRHPILINAILLNIIIALNLSLSRIIIKLTFLMNDITLIYELTNTEKNLGFINDVSYRLSVTV